MPLCFASLKSTLLGARLACISNQALFAAKSFTFFASLVLSAKPARVRQKHRNMNRNYVVAASLYLCYRRLVNIMSVETLGTAALKSEVELQPNYSAETPPSTDIFVFYLYILHYGNYDTQQIQRFY